MWTRTYVEARCIFRLQGMITGVRGLCNGLGPALYGLIFYLFHVDLNDNSKNANSLTGPLGPTTNETHIEVHHSGLHVSALSIFPLVRTRSCHVAQGLSIFQTNLRYANGSIYADKLRSL